MKVTGVLIESSSGVTQFVNLEHDNPAVELHVWMKSQAQVYLLSPLQIKRLLLQDNNCCILGILKFTVFRRPWVQSQLNLKIQKYNKTPENVSRASLETLRVSDQIPSIVKEQ